MANKSSSIYSKTIFATMQKELEFVKHQLAMASKTLAEKDQVIGSLEDDLAHMVEVLNNRDRHQNANLWIARPVPGIAEA